MDYEKELKLQKEQLNKIVGVGQKYISQSKLPTAKQWDLIKPQTQKDKPKIQVVLK
jgi:hypothetical protein